MAAGETDPLINPSAVELDVARILVEFSLSEVRHRPLFLVRWGSKRKRSAIACPPPTIPNSTWQPSQSQVGRQFDNHEATHKVETSSPATPLSFSSGSDDDKPKPSNKQSNKKKKEEEKKEEKLMKEYEVSSELVRTLELEVNKVQLYLDSMKKRNLDLKANRELLFSHERENRSNNNSRSSGLCHLQNPITVHQQPQLQPSQPNGNETAFASTAAGVVTVSGNPNPFILNLNNFCTMVGTSTSNGAQSSNGFWQVKGVSR